MKNERGLFRLIRETVAHAKRRAGQPYRGVGDEVTSVKGIKTEGDCGPFEVTITANEEGEVKEIKAVIGKEGVQN